MEEDESYI
jgi:hypothetical protein